MGITIKAQGLYHLNQSHGINGGYMPNLYREKSNHAHMYLYEAEGEKIPAWTITKK
jgi:hypothetical protein